MRMRRVEYLRAACLIGCLAAPAPAHAQDTGFGDQGFAFAALLDLLHDFSEIRAIAVQGDGKIVVAGHARTSEDSFADTAFAVARFTAAGDLDTTFGNSAGRTLIGFQGLDVAVGVAIQSDGRIVVAGVTFASTAFGEPKSIALARLTTSGQLDLTFGTSGRVTQPIGAFASPQAMKLRPDGRILVAGTINRPDTGLDFLFVQFRSTGTLDTSFGASGLFPNLSGSVTIDFGSHEGLTSIALQSDGRIVAAGEMWLDPTDSRFALARLTANGLLDTTFGTTGRVVTSFSAHARANGVAVQPDGRIVAAGVTQSGTESAPANVAVARYLSNGALDTTFGSSGRIVTDRRGHTAHAIATQASLFDVRFVVAGSGGPLGSTTRFAVARFFGFPRVVLPNGPFD